MIKKVLYKVFGTRNERMIKNYSKVLTEINQLEGVISVLSDQELKAKTDEFKQRYKNGDSLNKLLPEAFAVCREAGKRVLNMRHFDVQLIGGMVLNEGKIAEMRTGEGKTLVGTLAAYLNALTGDGVHVVTVNDYLANRDALEMKKLYNFLGLTVGINLPNMPNHVKKEAYACDITYGTNNEFGFDYLRDNMMFDLKDKVQRTLSFAVIDEVDSILIDEARTPLIISGAAEGSYELYEALNKVPPLLVKQEDEKSEEGDFWVDEKNNNVILSESGHEKVESILTEMGLLSNGDSLYNTANIALMHHLFAALKASYIYKKDQHYVVQDNEIVIVDEFTGRLMQGRRWSDGLHQAVEAKEGVKIQSENMTMASITFQNYFRMYKKLSGMTGTADTEAYEFQQIYNLETMVIPTNKPMIRKDFNDKIYMNLQDKYEAIIQEIQECHARKQPVLVGTTSVENSEVLSHLLSKAKIKHEVLNAKQNAREAEIIVQAGSPGAVTVATNMAGRGTDIILGGNPKPQIELVKNNDLLTVEDKEQQIAKIMSNWEHSNQVVLAAGGLCIIGTERHESRRIDNQLRGRAGRQGDPGISRFYLCLDDPLLRIFGGEKMRLMMQKLGMQAGESIEHKWLSRSIESAQRKVEGHNFDIRKQLLEYDNVSSDQRKVIYQQRDEILASKDLSDVSSSIIKNIVGSTFDSYIPPKSVDDMWDVKGLDKVLQHELLLKYSVEDRIFDDHKVNEAIIREEVVELAYNTYIQKMQYLAMNVSQNLEQVIASIIPDESKENWKLVDLDNLCVQNGLELNYSFAKYLEQNPQCCRNDILDKIKPLILSMSKHHVNRFERGVLVQQLDHNWRDHLTQLDHLRQGIHLRSYAQKDPKQEYKQGAFNLFSVMLDNVKRHVARTLLTVNINNNQNYDAVEEMNVDYSEKIQFLHNDSFQVLSLEEYDQQNSQKDNDNNNNNSLISRNSPCPCGSGKKYKQCCGKLI